MDVDVIKDVGIPLFALIIGAGGLNWYKAIRSSKSDAKKQKAEADSIQVDNANKVVEMLSSVFDTTMEKHDKMWKERDNLSNTRITKLETRVELLEETVRQTNKRVAKRDYAIRAAHDCPNVGNPSIECVVIKRQRDMDESKTNRLNSRRN